MYACIDLGSNSFHLLVARWSEGKPEIVERFSEKVQLGEGVAATGLISPAASQRGLACLQRFQQVIQQYPIEKCWAVGTNALRIARNADAFLEAACKVGINIQVISGIQEAMLVYKGVSSVLPASDEIRLVIDIGGGSTEIILGQGGECLQIHSMAIGAVSWRDAWFSSLATTTEGIGKQLDQAIAAGSNVFTSVSAELRKHSWSNVYASSGTAKMLASVCQENGYGSNGVSLAALRALRPQIVESACKGELLPGLRDNRRELILPGLAVLTSLMQSFVLQHVSFSPTALREGMLEAMVKKDKASLALFGQDLSTVSCATT